VSLILVACVALEKRGSAAKSTIFTITSLITNACLVCEFGVWGGGNVRCRRLVCRDLVPSALDSDELEIFSRSTVSRGIPGPAHAGTKAINTFLCSGQSVFAVAWIDEEHKGWERSVRETR
jgi:hypothetical protein